jgi:hypothetical protein
LNQVECFIALQYEFAHVADVKDTGIFSYGIVLFIYAGVRNGHEVTGKLCHLGPELLVHFCKGSGLHVVNKGTFDEQQK